MSRVLSDLTRRRRSSRRRPGPLLLAARVLVGPLALCVPVCAGHSISLGWNKETGVLGLSYDYRPDRTAPVSPPPPSTGKQPIPPRP